MPKAVIRLLALSGSLRAASSNTALLRAAQILADKAIRIELEDGIGALPLFNADLDAPGVDLPPAVAAFRTRVARADGLLIASPEYAHGVPGAFKSALDWLVSGPEFPGKPIALFHATTRGTHARAALTEILQTMSGIIVPEASISLPLLGRDIDAATISADPDHARWIRSVLALFADRIRAARSGQADAGLAHGI